MMTTDFYAIPNANVMAAMQKAAFQVLPKYDRIIVSTSGGSDSDIVMDMVERCKAEHNEITYVFFDTGLEYQATRDHLDYLEKRYGVTIHREKPPKPIPSIVREHGVPFMSKLASERIGRLQDYDFDFHEPKEGTPLYLVKWWKNDYDKQCFTVDHNPGLKEFLETNPPDFRISSKCCTYAKKILAKKVYEKYNAQLSITGIRKSEGGIRAESYKNCYTQSDDKIDTFRPVFWLSDQDKRDYEEYFDIVHSRCYTEYGMRRTGCAGCPFDREITDELAIIKKYEPKLYKACIGVFGKSYEYTRQYREFREEMKRKEKEDPDQYHMEV